MRLALFQPDIPQNTGALIRLSACFEVPLDIVEPCGFLWSEPKLKRAGMDYLDSADVTRHPSWEAFAAARTGARWVLLTTKAETMYADFAFRPDDTSCCSGAKARACPISSMRRPARGSGFR